MPATNNTMVATTVTITARCQSSNGPSTAKWNRSTIPVIGLKSSHRPAGPNADCGYTIGVAYNQTSRAAAVRYLTSRKYTWRAESRSPSSTVTANSSNDAGMSTSSQALRGAPSNGAITRTASTEMPKPTRLARHGTRARTARGNQTLSVRPTPSTIELTDVPVLPAK